MAEGKSSKAIWIVLALVGLWLVLRKKTVVVGGTAAQARVVAVAQPSTQQQLTSAALGLALPAATAALGSFINYASSGSSDSSSSAWTDDSGGDSGDDDA